MCIDLLTLREEGAPPNTPAIRIMAAGEEPLDEVKTPGDMTKVSAAAQEQYGDLQQAIRPVRFVGV